MLNESRPPVTIALTGEQVFYNENPETNWNVALVEQTDAHCISPTLHGSELLAQLSVRDSCLFPH